MPEIAPLMYSRKGDRKYARDHLAVFQHGLCAGCFESDCWTLHVDHDHATGLIRGLLCPSCNQSEHGGKTLDWQGYIDSTPASEMRSGLLSPLPTFLARLEKLQAAEAAALEQYGDGWTGRFWWLAQARVKDTLNDDRFREDPTVAAIHRDTEDLHQRLEPVIQQAVSIDVAKLQAFGVDERDVRWLLFDMQNKVGARRESEIRDKHTRTLMAEMASRTEPHHYVAAEIPAGATANQIISRDRPCAFEDCGIEQHEHPTWMPADRSRTSRATLRRREIQAIWAAVQKAA